MKAEILEDIWIGNVLALKNLPVEFTVISLLSEEMTLNLTSNLLAEHHSREVWHLRDKSSAPFLVPDLVRVLSVIDKSRRPVLVHCAKGKSRSAAVCAAWLISRKRCSTVQEAMGIIRKARPEAQPNLGFLAALKAIERHGGDVEAAMNEWNKKVAASILGT